MALPIRRSACPPGSFTLAQWALSVDAVASPQTARGVEQDTFKLDVAQETAPGVTGIRISAADA
jgi:hypothetical protein